MKNNQVSCAVIILNNHFKLYQLEQIRLQVTIFLVLYIFTPKHPFNSTKLVQDWISKIRNFSPTVKNLIKFAGNVRHNQQQERLKYVSSAAVPFNGSFD